MQLNTQQNIQITFINNRSVNKSIIIKQAPTKTPTQEEKKIIKIRITHKTKQPIIIKTHPTISLKNHNKQTIPKKKSLRPFTKPSIEQSL
jgi:hypothetical protein